MIDTSPGRMSSAYVWREGYEVALQPWEEELGERINGLFWRFFDKSEDPEGWNRRWVIERDIDWPAVAAQPLSENMAGLIESFFAVESFLPDFAERGLAMYRRLLGLSQSHVNWSYEELKHSRALQLVLERSRVRTADELARFRRGLWRTIWTPPFDTPRQMLCYSLFQEKAAHRNYVNLRALALAEGAEAVAFGLTYLSHDESFHHAYFRDVVKLYLEYDELGTAVDLLYVANNFRMPAQHLLPDAGQRIRQLARNRIGLKRQLRDEVIVPTIKALGFGDLQELISLAGGAHAPTSAHYGAGPCPL